MSDLINVSRLIFYLQNYQNMSAKEQETITHRILQKSTGKEIGSVRIFPQYEQQVEDLDIKLVHCDKISDNNNEVVKILNEDLNMSVCEDDDVDFEDMIIESMKDLRRSEDVNGISSDEDDDDIDVHKTINNSCDTSSELDETTKSDSSTKSRAATLKSTKLNKSHGRGETSKSTSSVHTSASSQRVTLQSFYQTLENDERVEGEVQAVCPGWHQENCCPPQLLSAREEHS